MEDLRKKNRNLQVLSFQKLEPFFEANFVEPIIALTYHCLHRIAQAQPDHPFNKAYTAAIPTQDRRVHEFLISGKELLVVSADYRMLYHKYENDIESFAEAIFQKQDGTDRSSLNLLCDEERLQKVIRTMNEHIERIRVINVGDFEIPMWQTMHNEIQAMAHRWCWYRLWNDIVLRSSGKRISDIKKCLEIHAHHANIVKTQAYVAKLPFIITNYRRSSLSAVAFELLHVFEWNIVDGIPDSSAIDIFSDNPPREIEEASNYIERIVQDVEEVLDLSNLVLGMEQGVPTLRMSVTDFCALLPTNHRPVLKTTDILGAFQSMEAQLIANGDTSKAKLRSHQEKFV